MKKRTFIIIVICIAMINIWKNQSYGYMNKNYGDKEIVARGYAGAQATTDAVLKDIKETGYRGNKLTREMKIYTQITIIDVKKNKYKIAFRKYRKRNI